MESCPSEAHDPEGGKTGNTGERNAAWAVSEMPHPSAPELSHINPFSVCPSSEVCRRKSYRPLDHSWECGTPRTHTSWDLELGRHFFTPSYDFKRSLCLANAWYSWLDTSVLESGPGHVTGIASPHTQTFFSLQAFLHSAVTLPPRVKCSVLIFSMSLMSQHHLSIEFCLARLWS